MDRGDKVTSLDKHPWMLYVLPQGLVLYISDLKEMGIHYWGKFPIYLSIFMFVVTAICFYYVNEANREQIKEYFLRVWIGGFVYAGYVLFYLVTLVWNREQLANMDKVLALVVLLLAQTIFWFLHIVKMRKKLDNPKS